jgi:DNA-binding transcriptional ArsR family regulator
MQAKDATPELVRRIAARFRALGDETRIRIMMRLRDGECCVGALSADLAIAQASVSKHLAVLREAGLVDSRREGPQAFYFVCDRSVFSMCNMVCDGIIRHQEQVTRALGMREEAAPRAGRLHKS